MTFHIITLFPSLFSSFCEESLIGSAVKKALVGFNPIDLRQFGIGKHLHIDDTPYGGGSGMIIRPEPVIDAIESVAEYQNCRKILLEPAGDLYNQKKAENLAKADDIMLICGRYEGFDSRINRFVDETISIGNFVMMGGEVAAMAIIESVVRLLPNVLGNKESLTAESFSDEFPVEYDRYTKPVEFRGLKVPDILLSGNHQKISNWRIQNAEQKLNEKNLNNEI